MSKKTIKLPDSIQLSDDFKEMLNLLSVFTEASNGLAALENSCNKELLDIIDEHKPDYSTLQEALTKSETALEVIALRHPEWFTTKQSIVTPYGAVKFHSGTKLQVDNEEVTVLLIEQRAKKGAEYNVAEKTITPFTTDMYIRTERKLNLESLEKLTDSELLALRIKRVPTNSFSVKPAKVDMGKAVKEAAEAA